MAFTAFAKFAALIATIGNAIAKCDILHGVPPKTLGKWAANRACLFVSSLFFAWGFIYGLLDVMNSHVREALGLSASKGSILAVAYVSPPSLSMLLKNYANIRLQYMAYIWGPLFGSGPLVKRFGYRPAFLLGLTLIAGGSFLFSFAAQTKNFWLLAAGMHLSGLGVSTLERAANPYVVNVGPIVSRTTRILFAQSMAGVGTVVAPLVAKVMLYDSNTTSVATPEAVSDLGKTISLYRYVGFITIGVVVLFAMLFYRTTWVSEILVESSPVTEHGWRLWKHPILSMQYARLWTGVFSNFFNMACQVTIAQFFIDSLVGPGHQTMAVATLYLSIAQVLFVLGRMVSFGLVAQPWLKIRPRWVLLGYISAAVVVSAICIGVSGKVLIAFACLAMFWEAPSFPMNFEAATVGLGPWAATAETMMIISISGGSMGPPLAGFIKDSSDVAKTWILVAAFFGVVWIFPMLCNLIPSWRNAVDLEEENTSDVEIQLNVMGKKNVDSSEDQASEEEQEQMEGEKREQK